MNDTNRREVNSDYAIFEEEDSGRLVMPAGGTLSEERLKEVFGNDATIRPDRESRNILAAHGGRGPVLGHFDGESLWIEASGRDRLEEREVV